MIPTTPELVRAETDARLAAARQRHLVRQLQKAHRADRRAQRRLRLASWWERRRRRGDVAPSLASAGAAATYSPSVEVRSLLDDVAQRVTASGTRSEQRILHAMSDVSWQESPGTAAALVDWDGTEISRLRAFGLVHGLILDSLGPAEHVWLLDQAGDPDGAGGADLVA